MTRVEGCCIYIVLYFFFLLLFFSLYYLFSYLFSPLLFFIADTCEIFLFRRCFFFIQVFTCRSKIESFRCTYICDVCHLLTTDISSHTRFFLLLLFAWCIYQRNRSEIIQKRTKKKESKSNTDTNYESFAYMNHLVKLIRT